MQELLDSVQSLSGKERKALAALLKRQGVNLYGVTPIFKREQGEHPSLSYAQYRQWFLWQLEPESAAYHIPSALRLKGHLDLVALQSSFQALIARHETLRTTFCEDDGQAIQEIHPSIPFDLRHEELGTVDESAIQARVEAEIQRPFDLIKGPLFRVKVFRLAEDDHVLVLTLHHIVSDGWSMPIIVDELVQLYAGYREGYEVSLPALPIQYCDYSLWQRSWMEAGERERQLAYWQEQLGGEQPVLELPTDRARPVVQSYIGTRLKVELDKVLAQSLKRLAQQQGVTLFMVLLASFQALLHRYSGQSDIRVGVPIANRTRRETEGLIGFFINTHVLKAEFDLKTTFDELLQQVKQTALGAQMHQDLPFEQLVEALQPERSLSHSPLFQVMYNHQSETKEKTRQLPRLMLEWLDWESHTTHFDLVLNTFESEAGLWASLTYATDLFNDSTVERLAAHWINLLEAICSQPAQRVAELPLLSEPERHFILAQWDQSHAEFPRDRHVHQLIEAQACKAPDAVAVIFADQPLSYGELDARANRLAHRLIELGVGPEVRVAIAMRRSAEIMVAFLAVLKAGGAYVPLDIAYPEDRLLYMMQDCKAALVLTQSDVLARLPLPAGLPSLAVDQAEAWHDYPDTAPDVVLAEENLAYVIYTSGSTGLPKGVAVAHGPLVSHILATGERYETSPLDCELHFMSFAFDGAHEGWMHPLINGARVLIRDDNLWLPEQTYAQMHRHGVTLAVFPPVYLQQLAEHAERDGNPPPTRVYCFGGDAVPQASWELAWRALRPQYLFNGYGPTETVVTPLLWKATPEEPCGAAYAPIGTLLGKRRGYVLDAGLNLLPVGLAGELYLGGEGVARGYLDRPALTAERFVPDPYGEGERVYRSGDLTRARPDGVVDYLGRVDHQVKIRGFRIELGEIEARLLEQEAVRETVVLAQEGLSGKQLVAYVIPASTGDQGALRECLKTALKVSLPDYMVPAHLLFLDSLPLTPNGKLDRKALPQPDARELLRAYVAPRTEIERQLVEIWQDVLKLERVGLSDNFFEVGGDSILAIRVIARLRELEIPGVTLNVRDLMQRPSIAQLLERGSGTSPVLRLNAIVPGMPVLFCVHGGFGTVFDYEPLARRLAGKRTVMALQSRMLLDEAREDQSLEQIAKDYVELIRRHQPKGPYHLVGWSLGGALAVLMSRELESQGETVEFVGLLDSFVPQEIMAAPCSALSDLTEFLELLSNGNWDAVSPKVELPKRAEELPSRMRGVFESLLNELQAHAEDASPAMKFDASELSSAFSAWRSLKKLAGRMTAYPQIQAPLVTWWIHGREDDRCRMVRQMGRSDLQETVVDCSHHEILQSQQVLSDIESRIGTD